MILNQLLDQARRFPIFNVEDCQKWFPDTSRGVLLLQLSQYVKKAYFWRLRRGVYLLNNEPLPPPHTIANHLRSDAVISLESVLSENGVIPETSFSITALTGGRNASFVLPSMGTFIFRHIEPRLLFGWRLQSHPPYTARVATNEKALLDLFWFHLRETNVEGFLKELRLTIPVNFSWPKFLSLARQFNNKRLGELARLTAKMHQR